LNKIETMKIKSFHTDEKPVSAKKVFSTTEGKITALQIKAEAF